MASAIERALGANQVPQGSNRVRGGIRMSYQGAAVRVDESGVNRAKQLADNLGAFMQVGAEAYKQSEVDDRKRADERSNEIIRKLTPEQRRQAIQNGTLLYQDDPYAMEALREKTGRNAAFQVDDDVSVKVKQGVFKTRQEMEEYRHEQLQQVAKDYAEQYGLNPDDEAYQRGFNADITQRNIAIYGAHDQFISERAQQGNIAQTKTELDGLLTDPTVLRDPKAGAAFANYITTGMNNNSIPTDAQASAVIKSSLSDVVNRAGGRAFLDSVADQKVTLNGTTTTYRQLMGEEVWVNLQAKASSTEYDLNAKASEDLQLGISKALNQADAATGMEMLQQLKANNNLFQVGDEMTPQRQLLINAQQEMLNRIKRDSDATVKATTKRQQDDQKFLVMDQQFSKRLSGEYVATDYKNMPSNETTGEWTYSDAVNYANKKLAQIDQMGLPDAQADALKIKYLQADAESGPFRQAFGTQVADAANEWNAAVINGKLPADPKALNGLRRIMQADPTMVASLYPEQAALFTKMDMMDNLGVDPQILIDGERQARNQSKEMRFEADKDYQDAKNDSKYPEMSRIPTSLDNAVRAVYDATLYGTGNRDAARQQASKFVRDNTIQFKADGVDGDVIGSVPSNLLRVNSDPKSAEQGKAIIETAAKQIAEVNPWITNKQLIITQTGNSIYLRDTTGTVNIRYDQETLRKVWEDQQAKLIAKKQDEAIKEASKRAPISQIPKARKEARERVIRKRREIPKFIYGRKDDD